MTVKLNAGTYEQVMGGNILYEGGIVLPPGKYHLKVAVRENRSGKLGTFEEPLVLPDASQPGLGLSSVVVSNQLREAAPREKRGKRKSKETGSHPLQLGARSVLPSVTRVFRTNQKLYVYLESYEGQEGAQIGAKRVRSSDVVGPEGAAGQTSVTTPSVALAFFCGGIKISEAGPFVGKLERGIKNGVDKAIYFAEIPLQHFPPRALLNAGERPRSLSRLRGLRPPSDRYHELARRLQSRSPWRWIAQYQARSREASNRPA